MTPRIIFKSDNGELTFRVKDKSIWDNFFHEVAFLAESGTNQVKFQPKKGNK